MTLLVALPDRDMLDRLTPQVAGEVDLVVWRPDDKPLDRVIDLLVMPYTVSYAFARDPGRPGSACAKPIPRL